MMVSPARFVALLAVLWVTASAGAAWGTDGNPVIAGPATGGRQLWAARYNDPKNYDDRASSIAVSSDGSRVFVTGLAHRKFATVACDASTGAKLWVAHYNARKGGVDLPSDLAVSPDGSKVFVTGVSKGADNSWDYATVAYNSSTGTQVWVARYSGPGNSSDGASSVAVSPDGSKVFVTGVSGFDAATVAYSPTTGTQLWVARYAASGDRAVGADAIAVSPDGSKVFVTGSTSGNLNYSQDYATVAYDAATGGQLWARLYNGPANGGDRASSIAVSPEGSTVFVTGTSLGATDSDYATLAYDASSGARIWVKRYNGGNCCDTAYSIAASPDGSKVFVTGGSFGSGSNEDYATVAYDAATGSKLWVARYNGPGNSYDAGSSIAASPDGSMVFVTGSSNGTMTDSDYATLAYDASTGARIWVRRYDGPANGFDAANSVAVSPDGSRVFVTGESSSGATTRDDFATVAYDS